MSGLSPPIPAIIEAMSIPPGPPIPPIPPIPAAPFLHQGLPCSSSSPQDHLHQQLHPHPLHHCHPRLSTCQSQPSANAALSSQLGASPSRVPPLPFPEQTRCTSASLGTWLPQGPPPSGTSC